MLNNKKISIVLVIISVVLFGSFSCGQAISPEEYEGVKDELAETRAQVLELQNELSLAQAAEAERQKLSSDYEELKQRNDASVKELESLEAQYTALSDESEDIKTQNETYLGEIAYLEAQLQAAISAAESLEETTPEINEQSIEQAMFALVNGERKASGLNELIEGHNLTAWAAQNSQSMAVAKRTLEFTDFLVPFQAAFIAGGYSTVDRIVNAAMLIWKSNPAVYENNILDPAAVYGAVSVVKSGDIYYITFLASNFP